MQTAGMWHGKARASNCRASEIAKKGGCAVLLQAVEQGWRCPGRSSAPRSSASPKADRSRADRLDAAATSAAKQKSRRQHALTPVFRSWDRRTGFREEAEVGSIRRRPVGGGLGVYEPVPDRTVSGNERINSSDIGASARIKSGRNVAQHHQSLQNVS